MKLAFRLVAVALVLIVGVATWVGVARVEAAAPPVRLAITSSSTWIPASGSPPAVTPPSSGSLAVDGVIGAAPANLARADAASVRPIASIAKAMTALVILETHPLSTAEPGPVITITQLDVSDYLRIAAQDGSVVPVFLGERFSERDLLLGLMLPSANNLALTASRWIDGTLDAFVAHLNARATALGMAHTHFADPDGLDAGTTSTAADLVLLAEAVVANNSMVEVVSTATATMPDGTVVGNLDQLLGSEPGWIGIKTGWTPEAGGCLLFAARRPGPLGAATVTVVGAVLAQPPDSTSDPQHPELGGAFQTARTAVETSFAGYSLVRVKSSTIPIDGEVATPWGEASGVALEGADQQVLVRLGEPLEVSTTPDPLTTPAGDGARAGRVRVSRHGEAVGTWSVVTTSSFEGPSVWWKLLHN